MILSVFTIKTEDLFVTMMQQEKYEQKKILDLTFVMTKNWKTEGF